jgi:hypothetical protein
MTKITTIVLAAALALSSDLAVAQSSGGGRSVPVLSEALSAVHQSAETSASIRQELPRPAQLTLGPATRVSATGATPP